MPPKNTDETTKDLDARIKAIEEREAALKEREQALATDTTALKERENKLASDLANVDAKDPEPAAPPVPKQKCICIRKCHHPISDSRNATRKIFMPGDVLHIAEGKKIPKHFRAVKTQVDEIDANRLIEAENKKSLPGFIVDRAAKQQGYKMPGM